jgi:hypothetical protein
MRRLFFTVAATYVLFWAPAIANAGCGTDYWQGGWNQYWELGANWTLGTVPQTCNDVVIPDPNKGENNPPEAGAFGPNTYRVNSLQIGVGTIGSLQIDSGSEMHIAGDFTLGNGGVMNNNGSLFVGGNGILDRRSYLTGGGRYVFQNDLYNDSELIVPSSINVAGTLYNEFGINVPRGTMIATAVLDNSSSVSGLGPFGTMWVGNGSDQHYGYFQYPNGTLVEHIGSQGYGIIQADKIVVAGTLNIQLDPGFNPPVGAVYDIMTCFAGGLSGKFQHIQNSYFNNGTEQWIVVSETVQGMDLLELQAVAVQ